MGTAEAGLSDWLTGGVGADDAGPVAAADRALAAVGRPLTFGLLLAGVPEAGLVLRLFRAIAFSFDVRASESNQDGAKLTKLQVDAHNLKWTLTRMRGGWAKGLPDRSYRLISAVTLSTHHSASRRYFSSR